MTRKEYKANVEIFLENGCNVGNHRLKKIFETGGDVESSVVRWCEVCGSITIDEDYDGRTKPGAVMKMKSPAITKALS